MDKVLAGEREIEEETVKTEDKREKKEKVKTK